MFCLRLLTNSFELRYVSVSLSRIKSLLLPRVVTLLTSTIFQITLIIHGSRLFHQGGRDEVWHLIEECLERDQAVGRRWTRYGIS